jgi:hypothetical protein
LKNYASDLIRKDIIFFYAFLPKKGDYFFA